MACTAPSVNNPTKQWTTVQHYFIVSRRFRFVLLQTSINYWVSVQVHKVGVNLDTVCYRVVNEYSNFEYVFEYLKEIRLWKLILDCEKKHISSCFASGCTAWRVRDRSQEWHLHCVTHCWKWDTTKTVSDADAREKIEIPTQQHREWFGLQAT